jgi:hypothetical protein
MCDLQKERPCEDLLRTDTTSATSVQTVARRSPEEKTGSSCPRVIEKREGKERTHFVTQNAAEKRGLGKGQHGRMKDGREDWATPTRAKERVAWLS